MFTHMVMCVISRVIDRMAIKQEQEVILFSSHTVMNKCGSVSQ